MSGSPNLFENKKNRLKFKKSLKNNQTNTSRKHKNIEIIPVNTKFGFALTTYSVHIIYS